MIDCFCGDPGGARTHDPMIKSHLLYQLSHGVMLSKEFPCGQHPGVKEGKLGGGAASLVCECKFNAFFSLVQIF